MSRQLVNQTGLPWGNLNIVPTPRQRQDGNERHGCNDMSHGVHDPPTKKPPRTVPR
jgi:hypothetical protein